jgi:hypothetical protein
MTKLLQGNTLYVIVANYLYNKRYGVKRLPDDEETLNVGITKDGLFVKYNWRKPSMFTSPKIDFTSSHHKNRLVGGISWWNDNV